MHKAVLPNIDYMPYEHYLTGTLTLCLDKSGWERREENTDNGRLNYDVS